MSLKGKRFLPREIAKLAYEAGWIDAQHLLIAISVVLAESNGYEHATHTNADGSIDRGLWQINDKAHPNVSDAVAFDATQATKVARKIYDQTTSFRAWSSSTNGAIHSPQAMGYAFDGVANFLREKNGFPV
jgi:hypothetical protein